MERLSAQINRLISHSVSDDGTVATIVLDAKHVGEIALIMSADCLDDMLTALQQAKTATTAQRGAPANQAPDRSTNQANSQATNQVKVAVPKNWLVSADTQIHDVVLLVFDHQTANQAGYALDPEAARKMAVGLVRNAEAVSEHKASRSQADKENAAGG